MKTIRQQPAAGVLEARQRRPGYGRSDRLRRQPWFRRAKRTGGGESTEVRRLCRLAFPSSSAPCPFQPRRPPLPSLRPARSGSAATATPGWRPSRGRSFRGRRWRHRLIASRCRGGLCRKGPWSRRLEGDIEMITRHTLLALDSCRGLLARISHHLTAEARDRPAITSLRLLTVLTVPFKYASAR